MGASEFARAPEGSLGTTEIVRNEAASAARRSSTTHLWNSETLRFVPGRLRDALGFAATRSLPLYVALLGFVLVLSSLGNGLQSFDDVPQRDFIVAKLRGDEWVKNRPWYDIYNLVSGDWAAASRARYAWATPWWTWPGLKIRFFRPVAAATLYVDHAFFAKHLWLAHLQSALWYLLACWLVCRLTLQLSRVSSAAALGALLFAVDDAHASPVGWLAGRNAIIGVACFAGALSLYVTASRREKLRWTFFAAAALLAGLLAAENVSSTLMYFVAYTWLLDRRPIRQKWLAPVVIVVASGFWLVVHRLLGFGSFGSGAYLDPIRDGAAFWRALPGRVWSLLELQFAPPWALWPYVPGRVLVYAWAAEYFIVLPSLAWFLLRTRNREIAFWVIAGVVGLVPLAASAPHERLLTHVGIAWWMVLAHMVVACVQPSTPVARLKKSMLRVLAGAVVLLYVVSSAGALAAGAHSHEEARDIDTRALDSNPGWWTREVIAINVPSMFVLMQVVWQRARSNLPPIRSLTTLGATDREVEVTRIDERTLELFTRGGFLLDVFSSFWRGPAVPLRPDEITLVHDYAVTVSSVTRDGRPQRIRVRFDRSIDDAGFYFVNWVDNQLKPFAIGRPSERQIIPASRPF